MEAIVKEVSSCCSYCLCGEESDGKIRPLAMDVASRNAVNWGILEREHQIDSSLLLPLAKPIICFEDCLSFPIGPSSTDCDQVEKIINTLDFNDNYPYGFASYWSSKGQIVPDVPEITMYRLISRICIVTEVNIRPYEVFLETGKPVYSLKSVCF